MQTVNRIATIRNIYIKLVGAGFSFSIFMILLFMIVSFNLFELSEMLAYPWLWLAFYGYGLLSSFMIDWLGRMWPWAKRWAFLLYLFAGFILFIFLFDFWLAFLIAGPVGAFAALLFYLGAKFVSKNKWISFIFAVILPILFVVVSVTDPTVKRGWEVTQNDSVFEAEFTYFNGEHKIPIALHKGEKLSFRVDFYTDDGWGNHLENKQGKYQPLIEHEDRLIYTAEKDDEYYIVVRGNQANGRFLVDWEIIR